MMDAQERVVHVSQMLDRYEDIARKLHIKHVRSFAEIGDSSPGERLCDMSQRLKVDCIVVGRRGMSKLKRLFLGSVSRYLVDHACCDVLVVKTYHGPDIILDEAQRAKETQRRKWIEEERRLDLQSE